MLTQSYKHTHTNKQANKETKKQRNKQANKHKDTYLILGATIVKNYMKTRPIAISSVLTQ